MTDPSSPRREADPASDSCVPWRCFYCDEVFANERDASEHFGESRGSLAGCQIKGHEHNLLRIVRDQEAELAEHRTENTEYIRAMESMRSEHDVALRRAEEAGYAAAVRAMNILAKKEFGREIPL